MCAPCERVRRGSEAAMLDGAIHTWGLEAFEGKTRLPAKRIGQHSRYSQVVRASALQGRERLQRRFRPDAASAARIRCARALARLSAINFPLVRSCSC
jgi:hypothetical protein